MQNLTSPRVVALVPCNNEEDTLGRTIRSLTKQTRPADKIIVIADNCTDETEWVAFSWAVEVLVTKDNKHMKSGALNQALEFVMPDLKADDTIVVVDADSEVGPNFIEEAIRSFNEDDRLAGVSGSYRGRSGGKILGWYQRQEFCRWQFDDLKANGNTVILSGAASAFKVWALHVVQLARETGQLKGQGIYDTSSITEDFELSLALLHLGFRIKKMLNVEVITGIKTSWRGLFRQRLRWDRGISENLISYGFTRHTRMVWIRRVLYALQAPVTLLCLGLLAWRLSSGADFLLHPFWIAIGAVMALEKMITVWRRGPWNVAASGILVLEVPYDMFLQGSFVRSVWDLIRRSSQKWR